MIKFIRHIVSSMTEYCVIYSSLVTCNDRCVYPREMSPGKYFGLSVDYDGNSPKHVLASHCNPCKLTLSADISSSTSHPHLQEITMIEYANFQEMQCVVQKCIF